MSTMDLDMYYQKYLESGDKTDFIEYALMQDVLVIPEWWGEPLCAPSVEDKVHNTMLTMQNNYFERCVP